MAHLVMLTPDFHQLQLIHLGGGPSSGSPQVLCEKTHTHTKKTKNNREKNKKHAARLHAQLALEGPQGGVGVVGPVPPGGAGEPVLRQTLGGCPEFISSLESQSKPGTKMVDPEACKELRRRPQLYMAGIGPY